MANILYRKLEKFVNKISFLKYRRRRRREKRAQKAEEIANKIYSNEKPFRVLTGPFKGMEYPNLAASSSELLPKLIGCYEQEVHDFIEQLLKLDIDRVINIGSGEGYYAVGMAVRNENYEVYAFDMDAEARERCRDMAELNNVSDQIKIFSECSSDQLQDLVKKKSIIICDCDGCEYDLFSSQNTKYFQNCTIMLELHEQENTLGIEGLLANFKKTHAISKKEYTERNPAKYPSLSNLKSSEQKFALDENRSTGFRWALLEPK